MTFVEIFEPGMANWRRQKDLEKVLVHRTDQGAPGRQPLDLDSGRITIEVPPATEVGCPGGVQPE